MTIMLQLRVAYGCPSLKKIIMFKKEAIKQPHPLNQTLLHNYTSNKTSTMLHFGPELFPPLPGYWIKTLNKIFQNKFWVEKEIVSLDLLSNNSGPMK